MLYLVDWNTFVRHFIAQGSRFYVKENEDSWDCYAGGEHSTIKCSIQKSQSMEENIMFKERHFYTKTNCIFVQDVIEKEIGEKIVPQIEETEYQLIEEENEELEVKHKYIKKELSF